MVKFYLKLSAVLLIATAGMIACKKKSNDTTKVTVNGADTVAQANLVALYHFNGDAKDSSGNGYNGAVTNNTFTAGKVGQALQCKADGFVKVTSPAKLVAATQYTVAMWVWIPTPTDADKSLRYCFLQFVDNAKTDMWGNINIYLDGDWDALKADSAKILFRQQNDVSAKDANGWNDNAVGNDRKYYGAGFGKWVHWAFTYDAATSHAAFYVNGSSVDLGTRWKTMVTRGWADEADNSGIPRGAIKWLNPGDLIIGNWAHITGTPVVTDAWPKGFAGKLDELRIYNAPLTAAQIGIIYTGELAKATN